MTTSVVPAALKNPPPPAARRWVEQVVGPDAKVVRVRRLRNAWAAAMHAVDVEARGGRHHLVLRRWTRTDLPPDDGVVENEAAALTAVAGQGIPVPDLVAADPTGEHCGVPALLMTRLPGRDVLAPANLDDWLAGLVSTLHALHEIPIAANTLYAYDTWCGDVTQPPPWSRVPKVWERAIEIVQRGVPDVPVGLCHRDYHPGNVLWSRGRVSGVVDWTHACHGAPAAAVAHCKSNVGLLFGAEVAADFARRYGPVPELAWFEVAGLLSMGDSEPEVWRWHDAGRTDITEAVLVETFDTALSRAVAAC